MSTSHTWYNSACLWAIWCLSEPGFWTDKLAHYSSKCELLLCCLSRGNQKIIIFARPVWTCSRSLCLALLLILCPLFKQCIINAGPCASPNKSRTVAPDTILFIWCRPLVRMIWSKVYEFNICWRCRSSFFFFFQILHLVSILLQQI